MPCPKCHGLMLHARIIDFEQFESRVAWRCVNCSNQIDATTLANRTRYNHLRERSCASLAGASAFRISSLKRSWLSCSRQYGRAS